MRDLILSLPTVLLLEILSFWLYVPNIVKLDSAYCNKKNRVRFQGLYDQPELICSLARCPRKHIGRVLQKRVKLRDFDIRSGVPVEVALVFLKEFGQFINTLTLSDANCDMLIKAASQYCTNVSTLEINQMVGASLAALSAFQSIDKMLVVFTSISENDQDDNICEMPNLRTLIASPENGASPVTAKLVEKCPNLTHLSLHYCSPSLSEPTVSTVSKLKKLVRLNLGWLPIDDAAVTQIVENCILIIHLDLSKAQMVTDAGVLIVATTLKLKSISLPCKFRITDKSLTHLSYCSDTLEEVHIVQYVEDIALPDKLTMSALHTLLRKMRKYVYTWTAHICTRYDILRVCSTATLISINAPLTDALLAEIALHCKLLRVLDIFYTSRFDFVSYTNAGLIAFIKHYPKLEAIVVSEQFVRKGFPDLVLQYPTLFSCPDYGGAYLVLKDTD